MDAKRINIRQEASEYPEHIVNLLNDQDLCGRMNDPVAWAHLKGPCGDEMEFYLIIEGRQITAVKYYTEGCDSTKASAAAVARLACGKSIDEALSISAGEVINRLKGLPQEYLHCSILAVSTLYRAIADYLLRYY